ncbi:MAG: phenylalanine--tRNA ligase subunit beta, partial [Flavobacterium sp.]
DLMICDEVGPICMAGVFGGANSGVTETTTNIFLESAYFNPVSIRKTAKRHTLSTDASFRFERGIDPQITDYALKRAALLIQEVAGGEITSDLIDIYPKKIEDFNVFLSFEKVNKLIGEELKKETIKNILASLDIKINSISDAGLGLNIPPYRVDVQREVDVIEEILRVYGYNNIKIPNKINASVSNSSRTEEFKVQNIIANQLCSLGFNEMMANSLTTSNYVAYSEQILSNETVTMLNPLSNDLSVMRQSMLFSALEAVSYNINRRNSDLKLFEFGKTYHSIEENYTEKKHLTITMSGNPSSESWNLAQKPTDFFLFKGYITAVLSKLNIDTKVKTVPVSQDVFTEGVGFSIGNEVIAEFGTIKKSVLKQFDIKQDVFYGDLNWDAIQKYVSNKIKVVDIPKFPEVRRDLALLVSQSVTFEELYVVAKQTEKSLLKNINLFDVYEGKNLPEGKKSYALSFVLQDTSNTLTDVQIDKIMNKLQSNFETKFEAVLR